MNSFFLSVIKNQLVTNPPPINSPEKNFATAAQNDLKLN
jgi:hypothetical protein